MLLGAYEAVLVVTHGSDKLLPGLFLVAHLTQLVFIVLDHFLEMITKLFNYFTSIGFDLLQ